MDKQTSRPEAAFVLLLMQATFWAIAGISAFPFALAGQSFLVGLGLASVLLAAVADVLAVGLLQRRTRSRRWAGDHVLCGLPASARAADRRQP